MFHLITELRRHRTPNHSEPVRHEFPAETLEEAVAIARQKMRQNYADPIELQNEDRTTCMDKATLIAEVNKEN